MVRLANKFKKNIRSQHLIMKVKGDSMRLESDYDRNYFFFRTQIVNHHNSEPFIVKGVGDAARINMEYFLKRAEQELNVYFKKLSSS